MPNPILEMLSGPRTPNNIVQTFRALQQSNNPNQFMQNLMQTNPQMQQVMQMVQNSNMSPKDLFYTMAKQKGVDPEQILRQLR